MTPLRILALDCATVTGWAATAGPDIIETGTQRFELRRGSSPGMRFLAFRGWLQEMMARVHPEVVVYEQAHHRGGAATELCVGFTTRVQEIAAQAEIEYRAIHSGTLKRWATGSGAAGKQQMIHAASERLEREVHDDNEADAALMLLWALDGFPETEPAKRGGRR